MDRRNCWQVLLGRSEQAVDLARQGCSVAAQRVSQLEAQMERLQTLQGDYARRLREAQDRAQGISSTVSYRNFLAQIGTLIERTGKDLGAAHAVLAAARRDLMRCEREQSKFEALIEREDVRAIREEEAAEQKLMEELSINRFVQQQRSA